MSRDGRLLDHRQEYSRSFVIGFMRGLYLSHYRLLTTDAMEVADVMGSTTRRVDGDCADYNTQLNPKVNLLMAAPGGHGRVFVHTGRVDGSGVPMLSPMQQVPGHALGIVIGTDNTPPTASDTRLGNRIHHGQDAPAVGVTLDARTVGDTADYSYTTTNGLIGMLYLPRRGGWVTAVRFRVYREGSPGMVTCNFVGLHGDGPTTDTTILGTSDPVDADGWTTDTAGEWIEWTFPAPVPITPGLGYYVYLHPSQVAASHCVNMRRTSSGYGRCRSAHQAALGTALTTASHFPVYEIIGDSVGDMEHGATDIFGYSVADPHASFTMRRLFMNNSGAAITVRESGIYSLATKWLNSTDRDYNMSYFVLCAARDVFADITVGNGETLEVSYTPQITV